jgi:hypothetical protein
LANAVLEHEQLDREALSAVLWEIQHPGKRRVPAQVTALPTDRTVSPVATPADPAPPAETPDRDLPRGRRPRRAHDHRQRPAVAAVRAARTITASAASLITALARPKSRRSAAG